VAACGAGAERAIHLADDHSAEHPWTRLAHCGLAEALVLAGDPAQARRILFAAGGEELSKVEPI
jgi:hypothetical protein